ncbi:MAG: hypothetical protein JWO11_3657 [Nocardioides sp.]|nr:hypothetical protein [Nocardioides sp.]
MDAVPTHAQLGSGLRGVSASATRFGDENRWRAAPGSATEEYWRGAAATQDPLQFTLAEADVHAVLLVRSALAHADVVGRAISQRRAFLPHSVGRIVVELGLRAQYLMDGEATPLERAERRLDDLMYAISEKERQRSVFARKAKLNDVDVADNAEVLARVRERVVALGFTISKTKSGGLRVSEKGRPGTGTLAEKYLSGEFAGVGEFLVRGHAANIHGMETALIDATIDQFDPLTGINMPDPTLGDSPIVALALMGVPLTLANAFRSVGARFEWPALGKAWEAWDRKHETLLHLWATTVDALPDDVPPTVMGLFGGITQDLA